MAVGTYRQTSEEASEILILEDVLAKAERDTVFSGLMGGKEAPIEVITGLEGAGKGYKKQGIQIWPQEPSPGSSGWDANEEDKEEDLTPYYESLTLNYFEKGFDLGYQSTKQYSKTDVMEAQRIISQRWFANQIEGGFDGETSLGYTGLIEDLLASPADIFFGGDATGAGDIADGDLLTTKMITQITASLKTGTNAIDGGTFKKFRKADAMGYSQQYFMILNPLAYAELKDSTKWQAIYQNADVRGTGNQLWDGMIGKYVIGRYDNMVLMESDRMPVYETAGGVRYARGLVLGAQAGLYGRGMSMAPVIGYNRPKNKEYIYYKLIKGSTAVYPTNYSALNHAEVFVAIDPA